MNSFLRRTWATINLDHLHYNIEAIKNKISPNTKVMAVVKADAYGHGDKIIAQTLEGIGINYFAVSNLDEALSLRQAGITSDILILGFTPAQQANTLSQFDITQSIFSAEYANELSHYCTEKHLTVSVHIKLDTGMSRIGFDATSDELSESLLCVFSLPGLKVNGIFTHFSSADTLDADSLAYTQKQLKCFEDTVLGLKERGFSPKCVHIQNSAGIAFLPQLEYTHARAGIIMYGVAPSEEPLAFPVRPLMELKSVISMVKTVPAGTSVSYNRRYVSEKPITIATVPIGYADGYPRLLSNKGEMLIHGKRAPIIGNICMDQLMLDVSSIPNVREGDIVTVVGKDQDEIITFQELSQQIGTISYELMCLIGRRVPRVYIKDHKTVDVVDYIIK